jgi:hypothetical protein
VPTILRIEAFQKGSVFSKVLNTGGSTTPSTIMN